MADFGDYPPNMAPQNALIARQAAGPEHAVVQYSADNLARATQGPANPFKDEKASLKRKNVLTGYAEETYLSEHTFRDQHRAVQRRGVHLSGAQAKEESARIR